MAKRLLDPLPGLGEDTRWDRTHLPIVPPAQEPASASDADAPDGCSAALPQVAAARAPVQSQPAAQSAAQGEETADLFAVEPAAATNPAGPPAPTARRSRRGKRRPRSLQAAASKDPKPDSDNPTLEADWGVKTYETSAEKKIGLTDGSSVDGICVKRTQVKLFGGKLHGIVGKRYKERPTVERVNSLAKGP